MCKVFESEILQRLIEKSFFMMANIWNLRKFHLDIRNSQNM